MTSAFVSAASQTHLAADTSVVPAVDQPSLIPPLNPFPNEEYQSPRGRRPQLGLCFSTDCRTSHEQEHVKREW